MAKVLDRVKNIFKKNPRPPNLPPGAYPQSVGNAETLGTITKPPYQTDDDDEEDIESLKNYNVPEQTRLKGQRRDTGQSDDVSPNRNSYGNPSPALSNPSNPQFRSPSSGFMTGLPPNNNFNNNNNMNTAPDLPSRPGFPFLSQTQNPTLTPTSNNPQPSFGGFPPGMNQNQSTSQPPPPPPPNNPQMLFGGFPPDMNSNQPPPPPPASNNSQPSFGGSPFGMNFNQMQGSSNNNSQPPPNQLFPGMNTNQTSPPSTIPNQQSSFSPNDSNNLINPQQGNVSKLSSSFRNQSNNNNDDNVSRLELDYPIENVLIDANIPSAMAVKINDVVEQDRLGNAYRIHRYTFQPSEPQHISYGNNQHSHQRSNGNSFHGGTRHIREIHNNHRSSPNDDMNYYLKSNKQSRRRQQQHQYQSETALNQYIDQLLHTPGSIVIQAQNYNDLQQILNQQLSHNPLLLPQHSIIPFQSNTNSYNGPVFHYTARALYNDPMRNY